MIRKMPVTASFGFSMTSWYKAMLPVRNPAVQSDPRRIMETRADLIIKKGARFVSLKQKLYSKTLYQYSELTASI